MQTIQDSNPQQPHGNSRSVFQQTREQVLERIQARRNYLRFAGKSAGDRPILMRDTMDPVNGLRLNPENELHRVIIDLVDSPLVQRLKNVNQLSTANWVFKDATHARFGHVLGSALLTADTIETLKTGAPTHIKDQLAEYGPAVVAFALTHDLGHIAPGSHVAQKVWFPNEKDMHEEVSHRLLREDPGFRFELEMALSKEGAEKLDLIVAESPSVPKWTWQLITAGGWNTDRGDWVSRDSHFCGVQYGNYDRAIISKNLTVSQTGELAIREEGVSSLESFFTARASMYRNVYGHPTAKIGEMMHVLLGKRARELYAENKLPYANPTMDAVLSATTSSQLSMTTVLNMVESWWIEHLAEWSNSDDLTLRELSSRILLRKPFKHFEPSEANKGIVSSLVASSGLDPQCFFLDVPASHVKLRGDLDKAFSVLTRHDGLKPLTSYSRFFNALSSLESLESAPFIAAPEDVFKFFKEQ